jgi:hypothetical protein
MNPMDLRRGITAAVDCVVKELKSKAKLISTTEEIAQVGSFCPRLLQTKCDPLKARTPITCHGRLSRVPPRRVKGAC